MHGYVKDSEGETVTIAGVTGWGRCTSAQLEVQSDEPLEEAVGAPSSRVLAKVAAALRLADG